MIDWIYPQRCLHCEEPGHTLCLECFSLLEFLSPKERCCRCFKYSPHPICKKCLIDPPTAHRSAALFENEGPAKSLYSAFTRGKRWELAPLITDLIVLGLDHLGWPYPEAIACPRTWGYNPTKLIAKKLKLRKTFFERNVLIIGLNPSPEITCHKFPKLINRIYFTDLI